MEITEWFKTKQSPFCEIDPYNPNNTVEGYISRDATAYYGALLILKINGKDVSPQLIMGTPKMHYPFDERADGTRKYYFPFTTKRMVKTIDVYEKLDGTNILYYKYTDGKNTFWTCKTRLRPFVGSSRFGDFKTMWDEVSIPYLFDIKVLATKFNCNLSFELYGSRNPHLIMYDIPLDIALLFGVTNQGNIITLKHMDVNESSIPYVKLLYSIDRDYVWNYEEQKKTLQSGLKKEEDSYYTGMEGHVWYINSHQDKWLQYKCKPDTIEAIHFAAGAGINKNIILATCWNALENTSELTVDFIKELLNEEFDKHTVETAHYAIPGCIDIVMGELVFRDKVLNEYKNLGMDINLDKAGVMRGISTRFDKKDMRKVYNRIVSFG